MTKNPWLIILCKDLRDRRVFRENSQSRGTSRGKEAPFLAGRSKSWNSRETNNFCKRKKSCRTKEFRRIKESRETRVFHRNCISCRTEALFREKYSIILMKPGKNSARSTRKTGKTVKTTISSLDTAKKRSRFTKQDPTTQGFPTKLQNHVKTLKRSTTASGNIHICPEGKIWRTHHGQKIQSCRDDIQGAPDNSLGNDGLFLGGITQKARDHHPRS